MDQEKWIRTWNRWFQRTCETAAGVGAAARCGAAKAGKAEKAKAEKAGKAARVKAARRRAGIEPPDGEKPQT